MLRGPIQPIEECLYSDHAQLIKPSRDAPAPGYHTCHPERLFASTLMQQGFFPSWARGRSTAMRRGQGADNPAYRAPRSRCALWIPCPLTEHLRTQLIRHFATRATLLRALARQLYVIDALSSGGCFFVCFDHTVSSGLSGRHALGFRRR